MTFRALTAALALTVIAAAPAAAQSDAQQDRDRAAAYLEETRAKFLKSIEGVSDAQWTFKPTPTAWSIAEVAEHIAISESTILGMIQEKMLPLPAPKAGETMPDDKVIAALVDRTSKFQAPEMLKPVNKWATKDTLVKDFNAARDKTIEFVKTTKEDLRAHAAPHPALKTLDTHQWVLLIGGHSARHTLQIDEVKTAAGYPKN
ncbi:MAG: DinB family protein [Acidobacteria bacterium]|nr:DinB family protein [Acidobacteriota bacterium]